MMFSYRLALILAVGVLTTATASAADLPRRAPAPVPYIVPPAFTWSGGYIGLHGGYARQQFGKSHGDRNGFLGGVQLGMNYQIGSMVLGAELEGSYLRANGSNRSTATTTSVEQKWLYAAKGRVGAAFGQTLVYGTAGLAMTALDATGPGVTGGDKWRAGYLVGAGIEHAFTNNLSLKAEYNYLRLAQDYKIRGNSKVDLTDHIVKAGLNYRF